MHSFVIVTPDDAQRYNRNPADDSSKSWPQKVKQPGSSSRREKLWLWWWRILLEVPEECAELFWRPISSQIKLLRQQQHAGIGRSIHLARESERGIKYNNPSSDYKREKFCTYEEGQEEHQEKTLVCWSSRSIIIKVYRWPGPAGTLKSWWLQSWTCYLPPTANVSFLSKIAHSSFSSTENVIFYLDNCDWWC